jgi:uncharacterized protein YutE (UPF0331/DUF86 family)
LVDPDRIRDRLARLDRLLGLLEMVVARGESAYMADLRERLQAERALQLSIQICIDIGAHLIAERGLDQPTDYRGVFRSLVDAGVLDAQVGQRLGAAAGLRNLLVHGYADLDDTVVWQALGRLDDLRAFAHAAAREADAG